MRHLKSSAPLSSLIDPARRIVFNAIDIVQDYRISAALAQYETDPIGACKKLRKIGLPRVYKLIDAQASRIADVQAYLRNEDGADEEKCELAASTGKLTNLFDVRQDLAATS